MSTQTRSPEEVKESITQFMKANFPQIKMHGGEASISNINLDENSVTVRLGGACSGCGVSPMTIQALKTRLPKDIPEITTVSADTGEESSTGMTPSFAGEEVESENTDAPF